MKLLLDQGLPRSAVAPLAAAGHEVQHVGDLGMAQAADTEILAEALRRGATVVTIDADFHALLALSEATGPSVIRLRVQGVGAADLAQLVLAVLSRCEAELLTGAVVTADLERARVRQLPLIRAEPA